MYRVILCAAAALMPTNSVCQTLTTEHASLYEEDRTPTGRQFDGSVTWTLQTIQSPRAHESDHLVWACITFPERRLNMVFSLRRNTDNSVSASHVISLVVRTPKEDPVGPVSEVRGLLMKPDSNARGVPISARSIQVMSNVFQLNLSPRTLDVERNTRLLKEQAWLSIALVYGSGRRAVAAVEKGPPGDRAIRAAFAAWADGTKMPLHSDIPSVPEDAQVDCEPGVSNIERAFPRFAGAQRRGRGGP